jgi:stage II sporulation protein E
MCGDAYDCFNDGKGHFIAVLSDGMGTGGRAAVDGAMASGLMTRLLKAGFGFDCSLRILNSSMLFKSTDESLATVDIVSIDLFTGEAELYKAGAAPTIVRRAGKTGKAVSTSLPVGILRDIGFDRAAIKLKQGDILLLMSDGAVSEGTDWIRAELEAWRDGSAEDLAEHISECARRRRTDDHEDDITVIAAILEKAQ